MTDKFMAGVVGCVLAAASYAADGTWTSLGNGAWSSTANWQGGAVASGAGYVATLSNIAGPILITNDVTGLKLKGLVAQGGAYTLDGQPLTLEGTAAGNYGLVASNGTHTVGCPVNLNANSQVDVENGAGLTTTGHLDYLGNNTLAKRGPGEWVFAGTCAETNASAYFDVINGSVRFASGASFTAQGGNRENFRVGYSGGTPGKVIIERRATVNLAGFVLGHDAAGARGTLVVDGGTLTANTMDTGNPILVGRYAAGSLCVSNNAVVEIANWFNLGVFNRGELKIGSGGSVSIGRLSFGWMTQDNASHTGPGVVVVGSGVLSVTNQFVWRAATLATRTNSLALGNGQPGSAILRLPATIKTDGDVSVATLTVDGGTLEMVGVRDTGFKASQTNYLYGLNLLLIGRGGVTFDTTNNDVAVTQTVMRDPSLRMDGGVTKVGTGRLTLSGGGTYAGPTVVGQGTLRLGGALPTNAVVVLPGAALSLADGQYRPFAPSALAVGQNGVSAFELEAGPGDACDCLVLPAGARVGAARFALAGLGGASSYWLAGDYVVATYADAALDISGWSAASPVGVAATFELQAALKRVVLHVSGAATGASVWLRPGAGAWSEAANWSAAPANDPGTAVLFGAAPGAAARVDIGSAVTLGSLTFDAPDACTLSGAGITFGAAGTGGTLNVAQGTHAIASALSLPTSLAVAVQPGASLLMGGGATGAGCLTVTGGGTLSVTNGLAVDVPLTLDGASLGAADSTALDTAVTVGAGGATLTPSYGKTLTLSGPVDGSGAVIKTGASIAVMSGANSGTGARSIQNGTLTLSSLTDGGELVLGEGTLKYVGPDVTTDKGFTIRTSDPKKGAALETDADITFNGNVRTESGVFIKAGKGTVTFAAPGTNTIGVGVGSDNFSTVMNRGAYGESPTQGLRIFQVLNGKVVLGCPGQTNLMPQTIVVGGQSTTSAGAETAGNLDVNGGFFQAGIFTVGRGNGTATTAPTGLVSTLRINGGEVQSGGLYMGLLLGNMASGTCNARPRFEMNGGIFASPSLLLGNAVSPVQPRLFFNGGFATILGGNAGDVRLAYDGGCTSETVVAGGTLAISNTFIRVADSNATAKGVLRLNGGRLITRGFERLGSGDGELYLNGGVLQLCQSVTLSNLTAAVVQAGGLVADVPQGMRLTVAQTLSHDAALGGTPDGGVTKLGEGTLVLCGEQGYSGPTVVSGGVLRVSGTLAQTNLTLAAGTLLSLTNGLNQLFSPSAFAAGDATGNAIIELDIAADGGSHDVLALPSGFAGRLTLRLFKTGTAARFVSPGRYPLMTFGGSAPDTSAWTVEGMDGVAAFEVEAPILYLRIGTVTAAPSVWTNASGGSWGEAGNWSSAPANDASASVLFGDAIATPATVTTGDGVTFGYMSVDSVNAYTWSGGTMTLGSAPDNAAVRVARGAHTIGADLAVPSAAVAMIDAGASLQVNGAVAGAGSLAASGGGTLVLTNGPAIDVPVTLDGATLGTTLSTVFDTPFTLGAAGGGMAPAYGNAVTVTSDITGPGSLTKKGSSVLTLAGGTGFDGELVVRNGTVQMTNEPSAPLVIGEGTFKYIGANATFARGYTVRASATTQAATFDTDADVTFGGKATAETGAFIKLGGGTLTYAFAGENTLSAGDNLGGGGIVLNRQPYGDTPSQGYRSYNIFNGKVVLGSVAGQTNRFSQAVVIGGQSTTAADAETAGHLAIEGGVNIFQDFITVGRGNGSAATAPTGLVSTLTVNGGETTANGFWMAAMMNDMATLTARPLFTLNDGSLYTTVFRCGNVGGTPKPRIVVNGGVLTVGPNEPFRLAYSPGCDSELTINGGALVVTNQALCLADNFAGARGVLNLNGGRLTAQNLYQGGTNAIGVATFNGGVFQPSASRTLSGLTGLTNGSGGAVFDIPTGITFTVGQALLHDEGLGGAPDGGLIKLGSGTLVLAATNTYIGPTAVSNGTLSVTGVTTVGSGLFVARGGVLALTVPVSNQMSLSCLTLGEAAGDDAGLSLTADLAGFATGAVAVAGDVFLGHAAVTLLVRETGAAPSANGTYVVLTCAGTFSGDAAGLRLANGVFGKGYTFAVVGHELRLTVGAATADAVLWKRAAGGDWAEPSNWVISPGTGEAGMAVGFLDAIAAPAAVNVADEVTAGAVLFNNANAYTLSGAGRLTLAATNGAAALTANLGSHTVAVAASLASDTAVSSAAGAEVWLTGPVTGDGKLTKMGNGRLLLSGNNTYAGGTEAKAGALDVSGANALGSGAVTFNGGSLAGKGDSAATVANDVSVLQSMTLAAYAPLRLSGTWTASGDLVYVKGSSNELVVAGTMRNGTGAKTRMDIREGTVRFAAGADVYLRNPTPDQPSRNHINFNAPANNNVTRRLTVEPGAKVGVGFMYVGFGLTNTVSVTGGSLSILGHAWGGTYNDALIMGAAGAVAPVVDRFEVSGGSVLSADSAWFMMGVNNGYTTLDVSGGAVSVGAFAMGTRNETPNTGNSKSDVMVRGSGSLEARQRWNWMADQSGTRLNAVYLDGGRLRLPPTFSSVSNRYNQSRLVLNGGVLETIGGGADPEDPTDYLRGLKQVYVGTGGAVVDTQGRSATLAQRLTALTGAEAADVTKRGLGTLTLAKPPACGGLTDVQAGTLRQQPDASTACPDDPMLRLSNENGILKDDSAYNKGIGLVGTLGNLALTDGARGTNGIRFNNVNALYLNYSDDMKSVDSFTISMWVRQSAYQTVTGKQTLFSTIQSYANDYQEFLLRILQDGSFRFLAVGEDHYGYGSFTADVVGAVPLNTWTMVTLAVDGRNGFSMYVNGVRRTMKVTLSGATSYADVYGAGKLWLLQPPARTGGKAFNVGAVSGGDATGLIGDLDEVTVYRRALSASEIALLYQAAVPYVRKVRVAAGAAYDLAGAVQQVATLTGEGSVRNGAAVVTEALNPGDAESVPAGARLTFEGNLTLGTNVTYTCNWAPAENDLVDVWGTLTVNGAGIIDLGLTRPDQMPGMPRVRSFPVMYFTDVVGAANFSQWRVIGVGRPATASVAAFNGVVSVTLDVPSGSLMFLR